MKNKSYINLISLVAVILITALPAYCAPITVDETIKKFLYAMGGVVASSVIIFAGLTIYNKFFVKEKHFNLENDKNFSNPTNTDDAIVSFIKRNRLR